MKVKSDFVTNSSSASFIISLDDLTDFQIIAIENHIEIAQAIMKVRNVEFWAHRYDKWKINKTKDTIRGETSMDNFDMREFLKMIGVDMQKVSYDGQNY